MKNKSIKLLISLALLTQVPQIAAKDATASTPLVESLTGSIPQRPNQARSGSQFAQLISNMDSDQREEAIREEVFSGNLPGFLRKLIPVELHEESLNGKALVATIFVAPDYLSIGSDSDFLRIPMNLYTAELVANHFGFILPTKKIVDAIYAQSAYHLAPQPMSAGPQMRSTAYYQTHNRMIQEQFRTLGVSLGGLVSGHKKDVVVTNLLSHQEGRIAIYGWHRGIGKPIQPLSIVHGASYADYSHGIRLISDIVLINGKRQSIYDVLRDPQLAKVLSYEGPIRNPLGLVSPSQELSASIASSLLSR